MSDQQFFCLLNATYFRRLTLSLCQSHTMVVHRPRSNCSMLKITIRESVLINIVTILIIQRHAIFFCNIWPSYWWDQIQISLSRVCSKLIFTSFNTCCVNRWCLVLCRHADDMDVRCRKHKFDTTFWHGDRDGINLNFDKVCVLLASSTGTLPDSSTELSSPHRNRVNSCNKTYSLTWPWLVHIAILYSCRSRQKLKENGDYYSYIWLQFRHIMICIWSSIVC